jgi:hypothetical protein
VLNGGASRPEWEIAYVINSHSRSCRLFVPDDCKATFILTQFACALAFRAFDGPFSASGLISHRLRGRFPGKANAKLQDQMLRDLVAVGSGDGNAQPCRSNVCCSECEPDIATVQPRHIVGGIDGHAVGRDRLDLLILAKTKLEIVEAIQYRIHVDRTLTGRGRR